MARTPGLDSLLARNRKAAQILDAPTTPDEATDPSPVVAEPESSAVTHPTLPSHAPAPSTAAARQLASPLTGQELRQPASQRASRLENGSTTGGLDTVPTPGASSQTAPEVPGGASGRRAEALSAAADRKQLNTYVRKTVIRDARRRAEDDGTTISDVVNRLLEGWLAGRFRL